MSGAIGKFKIFAGSSEATELFNRLARGWGFRNLGEPACKEAVADALVLALNAQHFSRVTDAQTNDAMNKLFDYAFTTDVRPTNLRNFFSDHNQRYQFLVQFSAARDPIEFITGSYPSLASVAPQLVDVWTDELFALKVGSVFDVGGAGRSEDRASFIKLAVALLHYQDLDAARKNKGRRELRAFFRLSDEDLGKLERIIAALPTLSGADPLAPNAIYVLAMRLAIGLFPSLGMAAVTEFDKDSESHLEGRSLDRLIQSDEAAAQRLAPLTSAPGGAASGAGSGFSVAPVASQTVLPPSPVLSAAVTPIPAPVALDLDLAAGTPVVAIPVAVPVPVVAPAVAAGAAGVVEDFSNINSLFGSDDDVNNFESDEFTEITQNYDVSATASGMRNNPEAWSNFKNWTHTHLVNDENKALLANVTTGPSLADIFADGVTEEQSQKALEAIAFINTLPAATAGAPARSNLQRASDPLFTADTTTQEAKDALIAVSREKFPGVVSGVQDLLVIQDLRDFSPAPEILTVLSNLSVSAPAGYGLDAIALAEIYKKAIATGPAVLEDLREILFSKMFNVATPVNPTLLAHVQTIAGLEAADAGAKQIYRKLNLAQADLSVLNTRFQADTSVDLLVSALARNPDGSYVLADADAILQKKYPNMPVGAAALFISAASGAHALPAFSGDTASRVVLVDHLLVPAQVAYFTLMSSVSAGAALTVDQVKDRVALMQSIEAFVPAPDQAALFNGLKDKPETIAAQDGTAPTLAQILALNNLADIQSVLETRAACVAAGVVSDFTPQNYLQAVSTLVFATAPLNPVVTAAIVQVAGTPVPVPRLDQSVTDLQKIAMIMDHVKPTEPELKALNQLALATPAGYALDKDSLIEVFNKARAVPPAAQSLQEILLQKMFSIASGVAVTSEKLAAAQSIANIQASDTSLKTLVDKFNAVKAELKALRAAPSAQAKLLGFALTSVDGNKPDAGAILNHQYPNLPVDAVSAFNGSADHVLPVVVNDIPSRVAFVSHLVDPTHAEYFDLIADVGASVSLTKTQVEARVALYESLTSLGPNPADRKGAFDALKDQTNLVDGLNALAAHIASQSLVGVAPADSKFIGLKTLVLKRLEKDLGTHAPTDVAGVVKTLFESSPTGRESKYGAVLRETQESVKDLVNGLPDLTGGDDFSQQDKAERATLVTTQLGAVFSGDYRAAFLDQTLLARYVGSNRGGINHISDSYASPVAGPTDGLKALIELQLNRLKSANDAYLTELGTGTAPIFDNALKAFLKELVGADNVDKISPEFLGSVKNQYLKTPANSSKPDENLSFDEARLLAEGPQALLQKLGPKAGEIRHAYQASSKAYDSAVTASETEESAFINKAKDFAIDVYKARLADLGVTETAKQELFAKALWERFGKDVLKECEATREFVDQGLKDALIAAEAKVTAEKAKLTTAEASLTAAKAVNPATAATATATATAIATAETEVARAKAALVAAKDEVTEAGAAIDAAKIKPDVQWKALQHMLKDKGRTADLDQAAFVCAANDRLMGGVHFQDAGQREKLLSQALKMNAKKGVIFNHLPGESPDKKYYYWPVLVGSPAVPVPEMHPDNDGFEILLTLHPNKALEGAPEGTRIKEKVESLLKIIKETQPQLLDDRGEETKEAKALRTFIHTVLSGRMALVAETSLLGNPKYLTEGQKKTYDETIKALGLAETSSLDEGEALYEKFLPMLRDHSGLLGDVIKCGEAFQDANTNNGLGLASGEATYSFTITMAGAIGIQDRATGSWINKKLHGEITSKPLDPNGEKFEYENRKTHNKLEVDSNGKTLTFTGSNLSKDPNLSLVAQGFLKPGNQVVETITSTNKAGFSDALKMLWNMEINLSSDLVAKMNAGEDDQGVSNLAGQLRGEAWDDFKQEKTAELEAMRSKVGGFLTRTKQSDVDNFEKKLKHFQGDVSVTPSSVSTTSIVLGSPQVLQVPSVAPAPGVANPAGPAANPAANPAAGSVPNR